MHTPRGTLELKYFFSSHVGTDGGGEASSTAIKEHIKELIGEENPKKPLSDNKLSELLAARGFKVARRTVAKYREMLGIGGSSERKQVF
jgi:RNA polymerase sigma-54 factor